MNSWLKGAAYMFDLTSVLKEQSPISWDFFIFIKFYHLLLDSHNLEPPCPGKWYQLGVWYKQLSLSV